MRSRAKAILLLVGGLALVAALVLSVGLAEISRALSEATPAFLALALTSYAAFFVLRGIRWKLLFADASASIRVRSTTSISAVGWLANSILPLRGGDVLRAALLARRENVTLGASAATVGLERILDLLGLAVIAALGLMLLPHATQLPPGIERALAIVWILPIAALIALIALVRSRASAIRQLARILRPLGRAGRAMTEFSHNVLDGTATLASRPSHLAILAPLTLAISLAQTLVFAFLVVALLHTTATIALAGSAIFLLSFVVSITPGNVGTYEAAFAAIFVGIGVAPEAAVPAGVLTHLMTTLGVAVLGGIGLIALGTRPRPAQAGATP